MKITYKIAGDTGEKEVVDLVKCPNCSRKLMLLPTSFPLNDVQCTGCHFRAQIKSVRSKPKDVIRGAGWDIMAKVLKAGFLVPPLIVNFAWEERTVLHREVRFYPFVKKTNLSKYIANIHGGKRRYRMFNYSLKGLPFLVLYQR